ncbi:MAG: transcription termination/antitermination factor NusG [Candidatus Marinimicrobia bacterium]|nr:transcription termination/antitermination factor NusG [Candidatus Neomarinimicrobiota bacterium]MBL7109951.1 transcription termination/antitermination factor NusG [Candidatus Neomarinimicrobiota bacterium]
MEWYSLRVISGKEKKTQENIELEAKEYNVSEMVGDIFVPSEKVVEMRSNKKRIREKVFFPGYILINMELTKETRYIIENTPGVLNFVGPKGTPVPLREVEIKRIFGEVEAKEGRETLATPFKVGDPVKVVDGPFVDFKGFVEEVNADKQKIKVTVSIFGRPTPVELDYAQVEIEK